MRTRFQDAEYCVRNSEKIIDLSVVAWLTLDYSEEGVPGSADRRTEPAPLIPTWSTRMTASQRSSRLEKPLGTHTGDGAHARRGHPATAVAYAPCSRDR